ncbi:MAG TPA: tetratricopeptide repeat protein [Bryobacteraceae bacterium]|nr:tetratricopeptide repeat protein [Bryobacteraceae bacterium]
MICLAKKFAFFLGVCSLLFLSVPTNAQEQLADQIRSAQSSGDYARAAALYAQLIKSGTDTPEVRSNYGIMLHLAGKNHEAMEQFRIALKARPALSSANLFAGLTLIDLGEMKEAVPYLKRARELDPDRPTPVLALGKAYVGLRQYDAANECYQRAVNLDNNSAEAWFGLGITYRSRAEQRLNYAARQGKAQSNPDQAAINDLLNNALKALTRAAELDPNSARTRLLMAESLADQGSFANAISEYQTAIKLDPSLDAAYLGLATEYWKQSEFDLALPLVQKVLAKTPNDPEANGIMADIQQHNGDNAAAKKYAEIALAGNPNLIETHIVLARVYLLTKQPQSAIAELQKALPADPDGSYHFLLYRAYKMMGDDTAAQQAMADFQHLRHQPPLKP